MTVTVTKKMTMKQAKNEEQNEKDLYWISSLRQLIPPEGDADKWKMLTPAACKIYLLIWSLHSSKWKLEHHEKKNYNYTGVLMAGVFTYSGMKPITVKKALNELKKFGLIKEDVFIDPEIPQYKQPVYSLVYELPPEILENGV